MYMKKMKFLFIIVFLIILCACSKSSIYNLSLSGNSNSYYNWVYEIEDKNILMISDEKYYGEESEDEISGLGGKYEFIIKSLKSGKSKVTFLYKKTWEDKDVLYKYIIEFEVDKKLNIKKVSESGNYLSLIRFLNYDKEKLGFDGNYDDYKLIFSKELISIEKDECYLLNIYDYNNAIIDVYALSINNDNIYKMNDGNLELIK